MAQPKAGHETTPCPATELSLSREGQPSPENRHVGHVRTTTRPPLHRLESTQINPSKPPCLCLSPLSLPPRTDVLKLSVHADMRSTSTPHTHNSHEQCQRSILLCAPNHQNRDEIFIQQLSRYHGRKRIHPGISDTNLLLLSSF